MARHSILSTISFFLLFLLCSCCKNQDKHTVIAPVWEIRIPVEASQEIFYDGLCDLPLYNDWIIAHTTVADEGLFREDNRLCAVNMKTKQIDWYFPENLDEHKYSFFNGRSYLYENKLIFRFEHDTRIEPNRTTVCLDLRNQKILWSQKEETKERNGSNYHVIGHDGVAYFVQNEKELCCFNCRTDLCSILWQTDTLNLHNIIFCSDNNNLLIFANYPYKEGESFLFKNYVFIFDLKTNQIKYEKQISPAKGSFSNNFVASGIENNDVLYIGIDRYLTALNWREDRLLWEREDAVDVESYNKQDYYVYHNTLMTCCVNATLGYDISTGAIKYYYNNYGSQYATFDGPYAYMVRMNGKMEIIEVETGKILDTVVSPEYNNTNGGFFGSYPTLHGDKLYIMGDRNSLFCYPKYPW